MDNKEGERDMILHVCEKKSVVVVVVVVYICEWGWGKLMENTCINLKVV